MNTPKKTSWPIIIRWVGTVLSLALLVWLLSKAGLRETWQVARQLSAWRLLAVVGLVFVSRVATFLRWNTLLSVENARVGWRESLKLTFAGLFSSNFLPTTIGGDVVRLAGAIRLNLDASLAAASLVADRLVGKHTGHEWKEIEEMFIRDKYMNAIEAKSYGLVDQVLGNTDDVVVINKDGQISIAGETPALTGNGKN